MLELWKNPLLTQYVEENVFIVLILRVGRIKI